MCVGQKKVAFDHYIDGQSKTLQQASFILWLYIAVYITVHQRILAFKTISNYLQKKSLQKKLKFTMFVMALE